MITFVGEWMDHAYRSNSVVIGTVPPMAFMEFYYENIIQPLSLTTDRWALTNIVSHHLSARGFKDITDAAHHMRSRARAYADAQRHLSAMLRLHAMKEAVTTREGAILARETALSTALSTLSPVNSTRLKVALLVNNSILVNVTLVDSNSLDALGAIFTLLNVTLVDSTTLDDPEIRPCLKPPEGPPAVLKKKGFITNLFG